MRWPGSSVGVGVNLASHPDNTSIIPPPRLRTHRLGDVVTPEALLGAFGRHFARLDDSAGGGGLRAGARGLARAGAAGSGETIRVRLERTRR